MRNTSHNALSTVVEELLNASNLSDSPIGQITTSIIKKVLSNSSEEPQKNINIPTDSPLKKLSNKWSKQILRDLAKIDISDTEKKIILAIAFASVYSNIFSNQNSERIEIDDYQSDIIE